MKDWRIHFAKNVIKAALPFKRTARIARARLTRAPVPAYQTSVIDGAYQQTGGLREIGFNLEGKRALEIGSGWHPIMPLMFRLAGCSHVVLTDVHRLLQRECVLAAVAFLRARKTEIVELLPVAESRFEQVLGVELNGSLDDMLAALSLSYHMIRNGWAGIGKVDVIFSHTTLEHISPDLLRRIFREAHATLSPGGLMSHGVDHTDHRANRDPGLSRIDFLRYSDRVWKLLCIDAQDYCNRLRHSDYGRLFAETGHTIIHEEIGENGAMAEDAKRLPLAPAFATRDVTDLSTAFTYFVTRPVTA